MRPLAPTKGSSMSHKHLEPHPTSGTKPSQPLVSSLKPGWHLQLPTSDEQKQRTKQYKSLRGKRRYFHKDILLWSDDIRFFQCSFASNNHRSEQEGFGTLSSSCKVHSKTCRVDRNWHQLSSLHRSGRPGLSSARCLTG